MRLPLSPFQQHLASSLAVRPPQTFDTAARLLAGVAVVFVPEPDRVLLIRRAERSGDPWSGQIGFPGGRRNPADSNLLGTAIRETEEEVGLHLPAEAFVGQLDDLAPRTPTPVPVLVRPFVFTLSEEPVLTPNAEVALALWVDVGQLRDPTVYRPVSLNIRGEVRTYPAYHLGSHLIWGLTERILTPVLTLAQ